MPIVNELQALPLFQGIEVSRLAELLKAFDDVEHKAGTVLFRPGDRAAKFELLKTGEVSIQEEGGVTLPLRPLAPVGELGVLTGLPRSTTATATTDVQLLSIPVGDLLGFFDANADVGLAFYKNLLGVVSTKVRSDRRRLGEMRSNIIRTQKSMKQMRELVLSAKETELSKPVFSALEALIENNRRANYRVSPTPSFPASVRLDSGGTTKVLEISQGYLKLEGRAADLTTDKSYWAGVLVMPTSEILVSGSIFREDATGVVVKLDALVDEYKAKLDDYTTRLQLLDFVV